MIQANSPELSIRLSYWDHQYQREAEFLVTAVRNKAEITLMLDLDVSAIGGFYTGECQLGMTREQAIEFVHLLVEAFGQSREVGEEWYDVGGVGYSWSDQGEPPEAEHSIHVLCRRGQFRIVISPDRRAIVDDYVATLGREEGMKLSDAISRGLFFINEK